MKNVFTLGIIALIAVITFAMIGCGDGNGGEVPDLPGTITITPTAATVGTKLTANYSGTEDVSYQWKHGASNVGSDSDEFTPNAVGSYTVTVSAAGFKSKTSAAVNVTEAGGIVGNGTVAISGSAVVGQTLTANTAGLGGTGTITYEWKNSSGDTVIGTDSTYLVKESDIGFTITVTVTRSGLSGPVTSQSTGTIIDQPDYGVTLDPSITHTFPTALVGSPSIQAYTVTVTNIGKQLSGNLTVSLAGDAASFDLSKMIIPSLALGASDSFTVIPKNTGLAAKTHTAIVTVAGTGQSTVSEDFIVNFTATLATVTFNSNGGGAVASLNNVEYGIINKPADPSKPADKCNSIESWYTEAALTNMWNFASDIVTGDITLYAKWHEHTLGNWEHMSNPTETENGSGSRECPVCGDIETGISYATGTIGLEFELIDDGTAYSVKRSAIIFEEIPIHIPAFHLSDPGSRYLPVTTIGVDAFSGALNTAITFAPEDQLTTIGWSSIMACESLSNFVIPNSVTNIEGQAFLYSKLLSIVIPANVSHIGVQAFWDSHLLGTVTFLGTITADNLIVSLNSPFPGDLREKYLTGGVGTYTATRTGDGEDRNTVVWTKQ